MKYTKVSLKRVRTLGYANISFDVVHVNSINHNYFGYFNHYLEGPTWILEEGNFRSKTIPPPPSTMHLLCSGLILKERSMTVVPFQWLAPSKEAAAHQHTEHIEPL